MLLNINEIEMKARALCDAAEQMGFNWTINGVKIGIGKTCCGCLLGGVGFAIWAEIII